ncbi:MAG: PAS domain-containing protein [Azospirillum sp.]|nr:PAS domain-containing protein [Azospirillum sp.]
MVLAWLAVGAVRARRAFHTLQGRCNALLAAGNTPWCAWPAGAEPGAPPALVGAGCASLFPCQCRDGIATIAAALAPESGPQLIAAWDGLARRGTPFRLRLAAAPGRCLEVAGRRQNAPDPAASLDILTIEDVTERLEAVERLDAARAAAELARQELQRVVDALPLPIWMRDGDLALNWCNRAFARAVESTQTAAIEVQAELADGTGGRARARSLAERARASHEGATETRRVVVGNVRRALEVTECPLLGRDETAGRLLGYAIDRTREEELKADLERHVSAHATVLEQLGSAIAIYGRDRRLKFFNQSYARLWGFDDTWLATLPSYAELLEELRTRRRLPEHADFPRYKREQLALFTTLIEPRESLMHLPDGTTLRSLVVPHPLGGLMFVLEDVTNTLALESSYNTLIAVQQETLDNLAEGIAVFGGDGRLKLSNPAYAKVWDLEPTALRGEPHVTDVMEKVKEFFDYGENWDDFKADMVASTLERTGRSGRLSRVDGSVIEFSNVPLPDGAVLTTFLDVSDSVRVERALRAANAALEAADHLKSEFLANVSHHLRTPLHSIMGFAELLTSQSAGPLNPRQLECCQAVLVGAEQLLALINDVLDLATIEAGYMGLDLSRIDLADLLAGVAGLAREWALKNDLHLEVDCPADIGPLEGDEKRLKQALFDLVGSAIRVAVPGSILVLSAEGRGDHTVLSVSAGVARMHRGAGGVAAAALPGRGSDGGNDGEDGSARVAGHVPDRLGLALVRGCIDLHGGWIEVDAESDRRLIVRCVLPVHPELQVPSGATAAE